MVLVGLDETEVASLLAGEAGQVVEVQVDVLDGVQAVLARVVEVVVAGLVGAAADSPQELNHGMIEVEIQAHLAGLLGHLHGLHLGDELLEGAGGKLVALHNVKEDVGGLQAGLEVGVGYGLAVGALHDGHFAAGALDAAGKLFKLDGDLDVVELEGDEGEGIARGLGVPEGEGNIQSALLLGVGDKASDGVALANHLLEALSGLAGKLFPHEEVVVVEGVHNLATNDEARLLDEELANGVDPVCPGAVKAGANSVVGDGVSSGDSATVAAGGGAVSSRVTGVAARELLGTGSTGASGGGAGLDSGKVNDGVLVVDQVTGAVEGALHGGAKLDVGVEGLLNGLHGEVGVLVVAEAEEGDAGVGSKECVKGTKGHELGDTSTRGGSDAGRHDWICVRCFFWTHHFLGLEHPTGRSAVAAPAEILNGHSFFRGGPLFGTQSLTLF